MAQVAHILATKGSQVHSIAPDASSYEAIERMVANNVGSLLVLDGDAIAGIFSERDFLRRVALRGLDARATPVREVMTTRILVVDPSRSIEDCMALMTQERVRHLPVVEGGRVVGVISIGDVVKTLSKVRESEVRSLTEYITGRPPE